jgi:uncharacterized protein YqhQ
MSDVLCKNGAKALSHFMFCLILICHAVFPVSKEIGTTDIDMIFNFHSMEHRKVIFLDLTRNLTFECSIV